MVTLFIYQIEFLFATLVPQLCPTECRNFPPSGVKGDFILPKDHESTKYIIVHRPRIRRAMSDLLIKMLEPTPWEQESYKPEPTKYI